MNNQKTIYIAAGGTGGHVMPALVMSEKLSYISSKIILITDNRGYKIFEKFQNEYKQFISKIIILDISYGYNLQNLFKIIKACLNLIKLFLIEKPNVILGFGSYVSLVSICIGYFFKAKSFIHESNSILGLANRLSLFFVKKCFLSFENTFYLPKLFKKKYFHTGQILRKNIKIFNTTIDRFSHYRNIHGPINILITGGSQGARIFSNIIPLSLSILPPEFRNLITVYHQAPKQDIEIVSYFYKSINIKAIISDFFNDIPNIIMNSNLIIARSGSSIWEFAALGAVMILIPYPKSKHNHQLLNAKYFSNSGAACLMEENNLTKEKLGYLIEKLIYNQELSSEMSKQALTMSLINGDEKIIEEMFI